MELSETDQTSTEVLVDVELLPVETLISFCLEKPSPQPHNEEGAGPPALSTLHFSSLTLPNSSQETRNSCKLLSCP